jgi:hypothetical protein
MKVVEAPSGWEYNNEVLLFLAGGIVDCPDWQSEVIEKLSEYDKKHPLNLIVFNPRRKNFPIHDKGAAKKQIEWEFNCLEASSIFSMWFCNAESDQPICMYELGRHLNSMKIHVIGVEPGYRREQDVYIQTRLASLKNQIKISKTLDEHVDKIILAYKLIAV